MKRRVERGNPCSKIRLPDTGWDILCQFRSLPLSLPSQATCHVIKPVMKNILVKKGVSNFRKITNFFPSLTSSSIALSLYSLSTTSCKRRHPMIFVDIDDTTPNRVNRTNSSNKKLLHRIHLYLPIVVWNKVKQFMFEKWLPTESISVSFFVPFGSKWAPLSLSLVDSV